MATAYFRDNVSNLMVPIIGGIEQAEADTFYLQKTGGTVSGTGLVLVTGGTGAQAIARVDVDAVSDQLIGLICAYPSNTIPSDWLLCDGTAVSTTTYDKLYAKLGTSYNTGGEAAGTFRLPNYKGRAVVGKDGSTEFNALNDVGGAPTHDLSLSQLPNSTGAVQLHNSGVSTGFHTATPVMTATGVNATNYRTGYINSGANSYVYANFSLGAGGAPHSNLQPYLTLNWIIKALR